MNQQDPTSLSSMEQFVLKLLINKGSEAYGREMMSISNGRLKPGTIYVTLMRMQDKGLVSSRVETPRLGEAGRPRRFYKPTALGCRALAQWEVGANCFAAGAKGLMAMLKNITSAYPAFANFLINSNLTPSVNFVTTAAVRPTLLLVAVVTLFAGISYADHTLIPSTSIDVLFRENLSRIEGLIANEQFDEASTALQMLDRKVYGYGSPEFSVLEKHINLQTSEISGSFNFVFLLAGIMLVLVSLLRFYKIGKSNIIQPSGSCWISISSLILSKKAVEHIVMQLVYDWREEHMEALLDGSGKAKLFFIHFRYNIHLSIALIMLPMSKLMAGLSGLLSLK